MFLALNFGVIVPRVAPQRRSASHTRSIGSASGDGCDFVIAALSAQLQRRLQCSKGFIHPLPGHFAVLIVRVWAAVVIASSVLLAGSERDGAQAPARAPETISQASSSRWIRRARASRRWP